MPVLFAADVRVGPRRDEVRRQNEARSRHVDRRDQPSARKSGRVHEGTPGDRRRLVSHDAEPRFETTQRETDREVRYGELAMSRDGQVVTSSTIDVAESRATSGSGRSAEDAE